MTLKWSYPSFIVAMSEAKSHSVAEGIAVGGHSGKAIVLGPGPGQISKRLNEGADELEFYRTFAKQDWKGGEQYFPKYFGTFEDDGATYMTMENLLEGLVRLPPLPLSSCL